LTDLQDCLGALNDIKVHQKLAPNLTESEKMGRMAIVKHLIL
jgi:hypothetical protein